MKKLFTKLKLSKQSEDNDEEDDSHDDSESEGEKEVIHEKGLKMFERVRALTDHRKLKFDESKQTQSITEEIISSPKSKQNQRGSKADSKGDQSDRVIR